MQTNHFKFIIYKKGALNGVGAVLNGMLERKKGHIVNISSDAGRKAFAGLAVYSGSKFFIEGFSQVVKDGILNIYSFRILNFLLI